MSACLACVCSRCLRAQRHRAALQRDPAAADHHRAGLHGDSAVPATPLPSDTLAPTLTFDALADCDGHAGRRHAAADRHAHADARRDAAALYADARRRARARPPATDPGDAPLSAATGWTCDDFPCEDDIAGFLKRIQVPPGFQVEYVGQFPGQPMQITYGQDGRLYATVLENGTRNGAVYVMDADGTTSPLQRRFRLAARPGVPAGHGRAVTSAPA